MATGKKHVALDWNAKTLLTCIKARETCAIQSSLILGERWTPEDMTVPVLDTVNIVTLLNGGQIMIGFSHFRNQRTPKRNFIYINIFPSIVYEL